MTEVKKSTPEHRDLVSIASRNHVPRVRLHKVGEHYLSHDHLGCHVSHGYLDKRSGYGYGYYLLVGE
jgi:hypothetical protein